MLRRSFLKSAAAGASALPSARAAEAPNRRPNFLFLIADDLTYRGIHALGDPQIHTPNLDRLVSRGCSFTHCFHQGSWSGAVCVPSRTMLNTGLTAFHAQRRAEETPLWGETLGRAGYDTFLIGKWHLTEANLARSFKAKGPVSPGMFESGPSAYHRPSPGNTWTPWDQSLKGQWLHTAQWQKAPKDEIKHSAQIWAEGAADYLLKRTGPNPFFLYVGFNSPHDPRQAPREYVDRYPPERIQIPPNYLPEHPFDQGDREIRDEILAPFPRTPEAVRLHRAEYYAHITYMDAQIGRILDALKRSGQAANTYVIFTADHGLAVGQHGLMGKQNLYDHSIRMPLVICGPEVASGRRVSHMVYQHSLFATACQLAGVEIPKSVEFPSLVDLLGAEGRPKHDAMFCYYRHFQRSVRTTDHKLIVYPQAGVTQLFDLKRDPWETNNLSARKEYAVLQRDLLERLRRFQKDLEDDLPAVS
ncbi:MAG TPA: sulfatase-like hydrolase/transferase [Bryobacteraceae bacterium]|nr:sulfatase-like hydrolase/transferase [Bryobacteraceae bacterium]